jgi:hypothetical protein
MIYPPECNVGGNVGVAPAIPQKARDAQNAQKIKCPACPGVFIFHSTWQIEFQVERCMRHPAAFWRDGALFAKSRLFMAGSCLLAEMKCRRGPRYSKRPIHSRIGFLFLLPRYESTSWSICDFFFI